MNEHHFAGQGPVLLDIGGDVGALVVHLPAALAGREIEIRPAGCAGPAQPGAHVAVVGRPTARGIDHSAVFTALQQGDYELALRPGGRASLRATVVGGELTEACWPGEPRNRPGPRSS